MVGDNFQNWIKLDQFGISNKSGGIDISSRASKTTNINKSNGIDKPIFLIN